MPVEPSKFEQQNGQTREGRSGSEWQDQDQDQTRPGDAEFHGGLIPSLVRRASDRGSATITEHPFLRQQSHVDEGAH